MGDTGDFHNWIELPGDFDADWHEQLRTNWEDSETRLIKSGTLANRPSSAPDGAYYLVEDGGDKRLTRYDESASGWVDEIVSADADNITPSLIDANVVKHATDISDDYTVDSGEGVVVAGPLTGSGSITGSGTVSVIQEGHQFTDNVDAQGNDISNVGSFDTGDLKYSGDPPGALVQLNGAQSIANDTLTKIAWETGFRDPDNLLNATNNSIDIPNGYNYARVVCNVDLQADVELLRIHKNASGFPGMGYILGSSGRQREQINTGWFAVGQGDSITADIRQQSGASVGLGDTDRTYMEVWLI